MWYKDTTANPEEANTGFMIRRDYIIKNSNPKGSSSFKIPLKYIFGFCEDYDKVVYGLKQALTLTINDNNDAIFRYGGDAHGAGAVDAGKITLSKISWVYASRDTCG